MANADNKYLTRTKDNLAIRARVEQFVKDWEQLNTAAMREYIQPDAFIDFSIFERGINHDQLINRLSERPKKTTWIRFDLYNYVALFKGSRAQITSEIVMEFVNTEGEEPTEFDLVSNFVATLEKAAEGDWRFTKMLLNAQEDNLIQHPVLTTNGIPKIKNTGDPAFVSNWIMHDDRIGWFPGKRMNTVLPEVDMPWHAIPDPDYLGSDEEQIERTIFAYYYGVDQILMTQFQDYAFNDDAIIIYDDGVPLNLREEMEAMRTQIQGSPRVVHVAKVIDIQIDGDQAVVKTYNRVPFNPHYADPEKREWRWAWARYRITLTRRKGQWKIDRLNYYPSYFVAEK